MQCSIGSPVAISGSAGYASISESGLMGQLPGRRSCWHRSRCWSGCFPCRRCQLRVPKSSERNQREAFPSWKFSGRSTRSYLLGTSALRSRNGFGQICPVGTSFPEFTAQLRVIHHRVRFGGLPVEVIDGRIVLNFWSRGTVEEGLGALLGRLHEPLAQFRDPRERRHKPVEDIRSDRAGHGQV